MSHLLPMSGTRNEPLLSGGSRSPKELARMEINFMFAMLGLCSSILWNQLLLSVGLLVKLFGESAISIAASSQNVLCALVMWVLTLPASVAMKVRGGEDHRSRQIAGRPLHCVHAGDWRSTCTIDDCARAAPLALCCSRALDGAATGSAQIVSASLGGMLSGSSSDASGALLLGEAAAPLLTALCSALVSLQPGHDDSYRTTLTTLALPMVVLLLALVALLKLYNANPPGGVPVECKTLGIASSNAEGASFVSMRTRALLPNASCVCALCMIWIYFLCSVPAVAAGLCGVGAEQASSSRCLETVPSLMVGISNVAAFIGRLVGGMLPRAACPRGALRRDSGGGRFWHGRHPVDRTLHAGVTSLQIFGGALSGLLTLWCNALLMRLSAAAQRGAGLRTASCAPPNHCANLVNATRLDVAGSALSFVLHP